MMQGVQSAMQQASQLAQGSGADEEKLPGEDDAASEEGRETRPEDEVEPQPEGAAPGVSGGERVPDASTQEAAPQAPSSPRPAPTRPADSSPETAL
jgi:hypothetical protein